MSFNLDNFYNLLFKQLDSLFFLEERDKEIILEYKQQIQERFIYNVKNIKDKYYSKIEYISPYHNCQYTMFLYFVANTVFRNNLNKHTEDWRLTCDKIYNLMKMVSSMDLYYEVNLADIFAFDHPAGSVIGRAKFGNYFLFAQGCSIGNNKGIYPEFGEFVDMKSNSKVLGKCKIGNNVIIAANTYIKDTDIPDNSIVFGQDRNLIIKPRKESEIKENFYEIFVRKEK